MKQSDERVAGRSTAGPPPSFGRGLQEPPHEEELRIIGGQAFLTVKLDLVPTEASLTALYESVRETVKAAIRDAYAEAVGASLPEPPEQPPGVNGGTSGG